MGQLLKRRIKILLLSHKFSPDVGGIETISELLADAFTNAGHEVRILTWSSDYANGNFQYKVVRNPGLGKLFKEHAWADFVFENNPSLRLAWPAIFFNRPSIVVLQTWLSTSGNINTIFNRAKFWWLKHRTKVVAISSVLQKDCWPDAAIIGNSYNANDFKIIPSIERTTDFVFVGRLVSDKGADIAIKALHVLQNRLNAKDRNNKSYSLTIIGDGPDRSKLEELVKKLNLDKNVTFTGVLLGQNLAECLNKHRYMLVPSIWREPFGVVALEGMACGCLPIVSDGGGLPDAVGNAGLIFSRGDINSLVKCIIDIMDNPEKEKELREATAKQLMIYHPDKISQKYLELINSFTGLNN